MFKAAIKKLTLKASIGLFISATCSSVLYAQAITIKVAAASTFAIPAINLVPAFQVYYSKLGLNYNVVMNVNTPQNLQGQIIAGGNKGPYDLFLSSDPKEPDNLRRNYPHLVVGNPFPYAEDSLVLYSRSVDISKGLPYPLTAKFVVPVPTASNYGEATAQVLASPPWRIPPSQIPGGFVFTRSDAGTSLAAVNATNYPYGFVAKSGVCGKKTNGPETYPKGSYHYEYKADSKEHPYKKLVMAGIKIAVAGRTNDQEIELANFVAFVTGTPDTRGRITTVGKRVIENYCLRTN
jgi:molybdate transport system substrate-binding protein